jgi:hypothetical protein
MTKEIPTPTLDKIRVAKPESELIGAFLEWLQAERAELMVWREVDDESKCGYCDGGKTGVIYPEGLGVDAPRVPNPDSADCPKCNGTGRRSYRRETWVPDGRSIEQLLAAFFGIDLQQAAEERQAVYEAVAAKAAARRETTRP